MKLIALRDFRNNLKLKIPGALHDDHVHQGAVFELDETDDKTADTIAKLNAAGCVGNAEDPKTVKFVDGEVAAAKKREGAAAKK